MYVQLAYRDIHSLEKQFGNIKRQCRPLVVKT